MFDLLSRRWWVFAIRGAVAIVFGILTLVWPAITVVVLVMVYGFYAIVGGDTEPVVRANAVTAHR